MSLVAVYTIQDGPLLSQALEGQLSAPTPSQISKVKMASHCNVIVQQPQAHHVTRPATFTAAARLHYSWKLEEDPTSTQFLLTVSWSACRKHWPSGLRLPHLIRSFWVHRLLIVSGHQSTDHKLHICAGILEPCYRRSQRPLNPTVHFRRIQPSDGVTWEKAACPGRLNA